MRTARTVRSEVYSNGLHFQLAEFPDEIKDYDFHVGKLREFQLRRRLPPIIFIPLSAKYSNASVEKYGLSEYAGVP